MTKQFRSVYPYWFIHDPSSLRRVPIYTYTLLVAI
jgi:hypothetical protein